MRKSQRQKEFQSSPGPKAGCYSILKEIPKLLYCFNPHPARKPDATTITNPQAQLGRVSILTRPESRMLHVSTENNSNDSKVSILTRPESRMLRLLVSFFTLVLKFQSSPGPKAGCYPPETARNVEFQGFNPHPARKPDATFLPLCS